MVGRAPRLAKLPFVRGVASLVESLRLGSEALRFSAEQMEQDCWPKTRRCGRQGGDGPPATTDAGGRLGARRARRVRAVARRHGHGERRRRRAVRRRRPQAGHRGSCSSSRSRSSSRCRRGPPRASNRLLGLDLEVQSPGVPGHHGRLQARDRGRLPAGHPPHARHPPRLPVPRRRAQDDQHLRGARDARVENARAKTTLHPRCGTTFLVMVALVSILVFTAHRRVPAAHPHGQRHRSTTSSSSSRSCRSCRSSRRSPSRSSASSRATAPPGRCARCSGRASSCRRSPRSSPTTRSSRSRSPRCGRRSSARTARRRRRRRRRRVPDLRRAARAERRAAALQTRPAVRTR